MPRMKFEGWTPRLQVRGGRGGQGLAHPLGHVGTEALICTNFWHIEKVLSATMAMFSSNGNNFPSWLVT